MTDQIADIEAAPAPELNRSAVAAAVACALCMVFGLTIYNGTFPLFLKPVSASFGWGAALYPQGLMIAGIAGALAGPFLGRLIDRAGVRVVLLTSLVVWAVCLVALTYVQGSVVRLYAISIVAGVATAGIGPVGLAKVVSGWFERSRGLVLGLVISAAPAAGTVAALLLTGQAISVAGWQNAYLLMAAAVIVIPFPIALFFLREAAKPAAPAVDGPAAEAGPSTGLQTGEAVQTWAFWALMAASALCCGVTMGVIGHSVAWTGERGVSLALATSGLSAFSLAGPFGSLVAGLVADRSNTPRAVVPFFFLPLVGTGLFFLTGPVFLVPAMFVMGFGFSAVAGLIPYFATRYFGIKHVAEIFGLSLGMLILFMGAGPVLVGLARDAAGAYGPLISVILVLLALGGVAALALPRYRFDVSRPK